MFGAAPPVSLPNLPPLPGLPADIFQQAQKQQDNALNLHLQRQRAMDEVSFFFKIISCYSKEKKIYYIKSYHFSKYFFYFQKKRGNQNAKLMIWQNKFYPL